MSDGYQCNKCEVWKLGEPWIRTEHPIRRMGQYDTTLCENCVDEYYKWVEAGKQ